MRAIIFLLALLVPILLAMITPVQSVQASSGSRLEVQPCRFDTTGLYQITCGLLAMPADHGAPDGPQIQLAVAVVASPNPHKQSDPVLFLHGGPGGGVLALAPMLLRGAVFSAILQERDLILVDQRGMGFSTPQLACPVFTEPIEILTLTPHQITERLNTCPARLTAAGIPWQHYTSDQNAADLAQIAPALGYDQVNLFGMSYGTLLGLLILRDHPTMVRSAVFDSVLLPGHSIYEESASWNAQTFALFEADCQADWLCRLAYPDLRQQWLATYAHLKHQPGSLIVAGQSVPFTARFFAQQTWVGSRQDVERLPSAISAMAEADYTSVQPLVAALVRTKSADLPDLAIFATMSCSYQAASTTPERIRAAAAPYAEPFQVARFTTEDWERCQAWHDLPPASYDLPHSTVPVLLLAGRYDPLTPVAWAHAAAQFLPKAQVFEVPYTGHAVTAGGPAEACTSSLVDAFFAVPGLPLDADCLRHIPPPSFMLGTTITRIPIALALLPIAAISLLGSGMAARAVYKKSGQLAWRTTIRQIGWWPIAALVLVLVGAQFGSSIVVPPGQPALWWYTNLLTWVLPLWMGLQAAIQFAPDDEPAMEVLLALPRPLAWLIGERMLLLLWSYSLVAILGSLVLLWHSPAILNQEPWPVLLWGWFGPACFLSGLGLYVTIRTRLISFGMLSVLAFWAAGVLFGRIFLPGLPLATPFQYGQAFLWAIHGNASWNDLPADAYLLNRMMLMFLGITLTMLAIRSTANHEQLLLNHERHHTRLRVRRKHADQPPVFPDHARLKPQAFDQLLAIARHERRLLWRQRGLRVLAGFPIVLFAIMVLTNLFDRTIDPAMIAYLPAEQIRTIYAEFVVWALGPFMLAMVLWIYPLLAAPRIPADEQTGINQWHAALPVHQAIYLAGKICGFCSTAILASGLAGLVAALIWFVRVGSYSPLPLLNLLLVCWLLLPVTTTVAMLLGATQPTTARALTIVIGVVLMPEFFTMLPVLQQWLPVSAELFNQLIGLPNQAMTARPPIVRSLLPLPGALLSAYVWLVGKALLLSLAALAWRSQSRRF